MADHNAILNWGKGTNYLPGFHVGSEGENGEHIRDESGWPYSIYREACQIGVGDMVLCHGIQHLTDAVMLRDKLNADFVERFGEF